MTTMVELADKFAAKIDDAIAEYGAQTVDLALAVYRLEAVKYLAESAVLVGLGAAGIKFGIPLFKKAAEEAKKPFLTQNEIIVIGGFSASVSMIAFGAIIVANNAFALLSPYEWLAAFGDPALMVMRNAMQAAGAL